MWANFLKLFFGGSKEPESPSPKSEPSTTPAQNVQNQVIHEPTSPQPVSLSRDETPKPETPQSAEAATTPATPTVVQKPEPAPETPKAEPQPAAAPASEPPPAAEEAPTPDWNALLHEAESLRKKGDETTAEQRFEDALAQGGPAETFCEGLFKIWRARNKEDLKAEKHQAVLRRVQRMLELRADDVKITDARSMLKAAQTLNNEQASQQAQAAIEMIEARK